MRYRSSAAAPTGAASGAERSGALKNSAGKSRTCTCIQNEQRAIHALHSHSRVFTALRLPADLVGGVMFNTRGWIALGLLSAFAVPAMAQSFRVQCPTSTITHPVAANKDYEPAYTAPTYAAPSTDYTVCKNGPVHDAIMFQHIAAGNCYVVMGDRTQTY